MWLDRKIGEVFNRFMDGGSRLAVDIGDSRIVVAEYRREQDKKPEMLWIETSEYPIVDGDPLNQQRHSFLVGAVKDAVMKHASRAKRMTIAVPPQQVFPRFVKLPPACREKLNDIIGYEAEQNVPFAIEEVMWDYHAFDNNGEFNVLLVAAKRDRIEPLVMGLNKAGFKVDSVDTAQTATINLLAAAGNMPGCTMCLDVGAQSSTVVMAEEGKTFTRSVPVAGKTLTMEIAKEFDIGYPDAEDLKIMHARLPSVAAISYQLPLEDPKSEEQRVVGITRNVFTRLYAEVNRTINFYRSQQGGSLPTLALLTGGSSVIPGLSEWMASKLSMPVMHLDPLATVPCTAGEYDPAHRSSYAVVAGIAAGTGDGMVRINLMDCKCRKFKVKAAKPHRTVCDFCPFHKGYR